jgi:hypothetical protein
MGSLGASRVLLAGVDLVPKLVLYLFKDLGLNPW